MTTTTGTDAAPAQQLARTEPRHFADLPRASNQDGLYPRPQMLRPRWADLDGVWDFIHDDDDVGLDSGWTSGDEWRALGGHVRPIVVPFPPESRASGIQDTGFHRVVWYRRRVTQDDLVAAGFESVRDGRDASRRTRLLLHFGAVDYRADVWLDGVFIGRHEGGHTPFSFDVTRVVRDAEHAAHLSEGLALVVRAEDDPFDVDQPRGKQDWQLEPHSIWYHRTTGIWQTVWLEAVPETSIRRVQWRPDVPGSCVRATIDVSRIPGPGHTIEVRLDFDGAELGAVTAPAPSGSTSVEVVLHLPPQRNGQAYEHLLWSPEHPRLVDATVQLVEGGTRIDEVASYLGLRSVAVERQHFLLNDRPYFVRSVLNQGYWPESHLAAPSREALRREVELILDLGFNATRVHQKIEDPRFLFWADRLGLMVWAETPGAFAFSNRSVQQLMREWMDAVERDLSHPSIVTWVPVNESWGVQHIAHDPAQRAYARALVDVTRALDPSRPVISNDGWEHQNSDIITIHDYEAEGDALAATYGDQEARARLLTGFGPAGRRILLEPTEADERPVMLTEFGGIQFTPAARDEAAWGYSRAVSANDFDDRVTALVDAVHRSPFLGGFCYTQLTDTGQEANGLLTEDREPKLPMERLRAIMTARSTT